MNKKIVVIGAGAAGLFAAGVASESGSEVIVLEKNSFPGKKLNITGKGRCNVTNNCDFDTLISNIPQNPRFMYSAFSMFSPHDMMKFLEDRGVKLKTERGNRVFPESDRARDITDALVLFAKENGARIKKETTALDLVVENGSVKGVRTAGGEISCDAVIVATGGASYPLTGSTGDGYRFALESGHTLREAEGSLVPLVSEEICKSAQGLTLKNVTLTAKNEKGKVIFSELGEMLFTHFGMSGPLVLSASSHMRDMKNEKYHVCIDLKPALTPEKLEERLLRDIEEKKNKDMSNLLRGLMPASLINIVLKKSGIDGDIKANELTREKRRMLRDTMKCLRFDIFAKRPISEAIITTGGVNVREINPKTMESKIVSGLYFAGEVLDVDAYTGGFNLQIAWSSAYAAGRAASEV